MAWSFSSLCLFSFIVFNQVEGKVVLEDGYEVTTVVDGHKSGLNPHTVHALPGSSNMIVLDSSGSTFYTTSFPLSLDSVMNRFAGDGSIGYLDGKAGNSRFSKPRGFAVDAKGNVYVADKNNKAIRKISSSGYVTTIAGGISNEFGHRDGPAQNATFSSDFDITFVPQRCCLLVSDHGNQMIRQINLKEEDCLESSHSDSNLGTYSLWSIGIALSCFLGVAIGFASRPYIIRHEEVNHLSFIATWKLLLIRLGEQVRTFFSYTRSLVAGSTLSSLLRRLVMMIVSHLSLMCSAISRLVWSVVSPLFFVCQPNNVVILDKTVSLPDPETTSQSQPQLSLKPSDDLMDLITFDDAEETNNAEDRTDQETVTATSFVNVVF